MKNNDLNGNQDFEKSLKDKMNELSSSVDCFDRISAKAFPEKSADFSESGFVVCDLENITGKSKKVPFLKWTAVVVACVVCAVIIPKSTFFDNLIANFSSNSKKTYNKIIDEINTETAKNSYRVYDMPLDDYIKYDRLVTPLYSCPFEDCGKDGVNVRIFVRTCDDIPTNQVYAVEYMGDYVQSNFIDVAYSKAKFSDNDLKYIDEIYTESDETLLMSAVMANFKATITAESFLTDSSGNKVSLASFEYGNIFKSDDGTIYYSPSDFIYYGDRIDGTPEKYYYDISKTPDISEDGVWKHSVCFDGFSAMPEESKSLFTRMSMFSNKISDDYDISYAYITPDAPELFDGDDSDDSNDINFYSLDLRSFSESDISTVAVPYDKDVLKTLKMYFSQSGLFFSSYSDAAVAVTSVDAEMTAIVSYDDENYHQFPLDEENIIIDSEDTRYMTEQEEMEEEARQQRAEQFNVEQSDAEETTPYLEFEF
ncbi:MAG: hypothetical protein J6B74_00755 [Ruminococcus sp.]|nr:hypothetical protein [Ruminococcus sp.]